MNAGSGLSDERLVSFSKDGNLEAFNSLVARYEGPVYALCYRLLGSREAAEDATQETFLSAYRAIGRFGGENFRAWVMRIAANHAKDEWRRRGRRDRAGSLDQMMEELGGAAEVADESAAVAELVESGELAAIVQEALMGLPFDQRQAVLLVDLQDHKYEEAAAMMGASVGTVKSRVHRGRERLRRIFAARPELLASYRRLDPQEVDER